MSVTAAAADRGGAELLSRAQKLLEPELKAWAQTLPAEIWPWVGHHLGWLDEHSHPVQRSRGKCVRPALAFACCRTAGSSSAKGVNAALAVELAHNFSLLHDDIIDEDELRRHHPTVWKAFGVHAGILAGDALLALAFRVLADNPGPFDGLEVILLSDAVQALVEGEARDVAFEARSVVSVAEYEQMAAGKTGALMGVACALGALCGEADPCLAEHLEAFGRHLGIAFQIVDDLLGIFGDPRTTGKPAGNDLAVRKKTLPVVATLAADCPAAVEFADLYAQRTPLAPYQIARAGQLVVEAGGAETARRMVAGHLTLSRAALDAAALGPREREELELLARLLTDRDH